MNQLSIPFPIESFGLFLCFGFFVCFYLMKRHPLRRKTIPLTAFYSALNTALISGFVGSKLLFILYNTETVFFKTGFSLLGALIAVPLCLGYQLRKKPAFFWVMLDLFALHAPLLQSIARIGCFYSGCCYGTITNLPWAIQYAPPSFAPLNTGLHPVQLYSTALLFCIFLVLTLLFKRLVYLPGQISIVYFMLASIERFSIDFFRGDREFITKVWSISLHQFIALSLFFISFVIWFYVIKAGYLYRYERVFDS